MNTIPTATDDWRLPIRASSDREDRSEPSDARESPLVRFFRRRGLRRDQFEKRRDRLIQKTPPPTFWLFGKTGSGKSSIVRFLTGADDVRIGDGFRPTTRRTFIYDFPDSDLPLLRFLDTRGLGEAGYSAQEDIDAVKQSAHTMIVTQKLTDFAAESVIEPLKQIRRSAPDRPVLLALTCLHEAYPRQQHPPYPSDLSFDKPKIPPSVNRAITEQREMFGQLVDAIVPIDLTRPEEGFDDPDYGGEQLKRTLIDMLPAAYRCSLKNTTELLGGLKDLHQRMAMSYVYSAAGMAAAASLSPVPWIDIPFLVAIQTRMVYAIARVYRRQGSAKELLEMLAAGGAGFAVRMGARELVKFVPFVGTVAGGVLGAALGYSYTYGLGKVCCWYYGSLLDGHQPTREEINRVFKAQWREGLKLWETMRNQQE